MKHLIIFLTVVTILFTQSNKIVAQITYKSRIDAKTVSTITITRDGGKVTYSTKLEHNLDDAITSNVFDHDTLLKRESDRIINKSDKDVFLIPFDNMEPVVLQRQNAFCIECICDNPSQGGSCVATSTFGRACQNNGCNCCSAIIKNCATNIYSRGGGVFLYGTSCIKSDTLMKFHSKTTDSTASQISIKYDACSDTYLYIIYSIAVDTSVKTQTYNLTSFDLSGKKFFVPENGSYWFIPAKSTISPFLLRQAAYYCIMCACDGNGSCGEGGDGGQIWCDESSCGGCCDMYILWCDDYSARINYGGGILVKSKNVILDN